MSGVRIKLDLSKVVRGPPLQWVFVNRRELDRVSDLVEHLKDKYQIAKDVELYLEDCLIPESEPTEILQSQDLLVLKFSRKRKIAQEDEIDEKSSPAKKRRRKKSSVNDEESVREIEAPAKPDQNPPASSSSQKETPKVTSPQQNENSSSDLSEDVKKSKQVEKQDDIVKPTQSKPKNKIAPSKKTSSKELADEQGIVEKESTPQAATVSVGKSSNQKTKFASSDENSCDETEAVDNKNVAKAEEEGQSKRKRRRRRKQKNKNKLPPEAVDSNETGFPDQSAASQVSSKTVKPEKSEEPSITADDVSAAQKQPEKFCKFFAKGQCKRSDNCKFKHQAANSRKDLSSVGDDVTDNSYAPQLNDDESAAESRGTNLDVEAVNKKSSVISGENEAVNKKSSVISGESLATNGGVTSSSKSVNFGASCSVVTCEDELLGIAQPNGGGSDHFSSPRRVNNSRSARELRNDDSSVESRNTSTPASPSAYNGLEVLLSLAGNNKPPVKASRQDSEAPKKASDEKVTVPSAGVAKTDGNISSLPKAMWGLMESGKRLAFKILEMTSNYEPQISAYKTGQIVSVDQPDKITVQLDETEPDKDNGQPTAGRFEIDNEEAEEEPSNVLTLTWTDLIEPRVLANS